MLRSSVCLTLSWSADLAHLSTRCVAKPLGFCCALFVSRSCARNRLIGGWKREGCLPDTDAFGSCCAGWFEGWQLTHRHTSAVAQKLAIKYWECLPKWRHEQLHSPKVISRTTHLEIWTYHHRPLANFNWYATNLTGRLHWKILSFEAFKPQKMSENCHQLRDDLGLLGFSAPCHVRCAGPLHQGGCCRVSLPSGGWAQPQWGRGGMGCGFRSCELEMPGTQLSALDLWRIFFVVGWFLLRIWFDYFTVIANWNYSSFTCLHACKPA